jgi:hypothetical protein
MEDGWVSEVMRLITDCSNVWGKRGKSSDVMSPPNAGHQVIGSLVVPLKESFRD